MNKYTALSIIIFFVIVGIFVMPTIREPVYRNSTATLYVQTNTTRVIYDSGPSTVYSVEFYDKMTIGGKNYELAIRHITVNGNKYKVTSDGFTYPSVTLPSFAETITVDGEVLSITEEFIKPVSGLGFYDESFEMLLMVALSVLGLLGMYYAENEKSLKGAFEFMVLLLVVELAIVAWTLL